MSISALGGAFAFTSIGSARLNAPAPENTGSAIRDQFLEFARMTPAEKMRAAMLSRLGLKEGDLESMDADARAAVEKQIAEMIKEEAKAKADQRPGQIVDLKA